MNETVRADAGASWFAAQSVERFERPQLTFDLDVDVCVIGGGLAGLTAAREVARRGWSVAVIEARRIAWNASGRNCGFVMPGFGPDPRRMVDRIGIDGARELWKLSEAGVEYVRATIRDTEMSGVEPVEGWLDVSKVDNGDDMLALVTLLGQEFGAPIEGWPTERVRAVLRSESYFHAIHHRTAFHIDPLNYAHGLANAAIAAGAAIFEETPALAIDPTGVRKRIATPSGRVRAAHIVLAGNAHLGELVPDLAETVMPVTGYVAVTAPLGGRLADAIAYRGAVSDSRLSNHHYRIVGDDRLMWAGGAGLWPRGAKKTAPLFQAAIARTFPQLGPVDIDYAWSSVMGFSIHGMPQVGEVIPGLWLASAFGAHGLNTTAMAGELIAGAIADRDDRWRLFLPYELVWTGGRLGTFVRHVGAWSRRKTEDWVADLARRREEARRNEAQIMSPADRHAAFDTLPADPALPPPEPVTPGPADQSLVPQVESLLRQAARRAEPQAPAGSRPRPVRKKVPPLGDSARESEPGSPPVADTSPRAE